MLRKEEQIATWQAKKTTSTREMEDVRGNSKINANNATVEATPTQLQSSVGISRMYM